MGILDRIAGTLDELTGDGRAAIADEVARARALAADGNPARAETLLDEITRRSPRPPRLFWRSGSCGQGGALWRKRSRRSDGPSILDGGYAAAWCALGETLAGLGRVDPARDALRRTLTLAFDSQSLRRRATAALGRVHATAGKLTHAARELQKAIEMAAPTAPTIAGWHWITAGCWPGSVSARRPSGSRGRRAPRTPTRRSSPKRRRSRPTMRGPRRCCARGWGGRRRTSPCALRWSRFSCTALAPRRRPCSPKPPRQSPRAIRAPGQRCERRPRGPDAGARR